MNARCLLLAALSLAIASSHMNVGWNSSGHTMALWRKAHPGEHYKGEGFAGSSDQTLLSSVGRYFTPQWVWEFPADSPTTIPLFGSPQLPFAKSCASAIVPKLLSIACSTSPAAVTLISRRQNSQVHCVWPSSHRRHRYLDHSLTTCLMPQQ